MITQKRPQSADEEQVDAIGRTCVMRIEVHAMQIVLRCPTCSTTLDATIGDPRGLSDVQCPECMAAFDISRSADVVIV
jgi:hypothetical protein